MNSGGDPDFDGDLSGHLDDTFDRERGGAFTTNPYAQNCFQRLWATSNATASESTYIPDADEAEPCTDDGDLRKLLGI
ncbi:hypothetical protein PC123_g10572 [Phytophthora cactorum]|nr:hypothetical protein PC123_g10572 [Phytophthora cactorum]